MAVRGFLSGVFWGSVVAALGLGVVSQFVPLPQAPVAAPAPAPAAAPAPVVEPAPTPEPAPVPTPAAPAAPAAEVPAATAIPNDPAAPAVPEVVADPAVALAPKAAAQTPLAPAAPDATPPAPAVPAASETPSATDTPAPLTAPTAEMLPPVTSPQPPHPEPVADAPAAMPTPDPSAPAPTVAAPVDGAAVAPAAITPTPPAVDPQPDAAALPPPPPLTAAEQALLQPVPEAAPEALLVPDQPILKPVPGLGEGVAGVITGRLPRIGDAPQPEPAAAVIEPPALVRFARPFDNPDAKPLFALILIDSGAPELDRARLAALPFALTFAIDPLVPDAAAAAALYRAAGQEVIMLATGIPQGATASDLEVTFAAHDSALPQAVAVLDLEAGGFQNDRPLATAVVPVIQGLGRGLLTWDKGLNAGDQVARRNGLAAAVIFRRLDGDAESIPTMKRYLDRAAFKAAQDGSVAVVGTTRDETVAAILEWTVEGRAASLALAPVTAVLTTP